MPDASRSQPAPAAQLEAILAATDQAVIVESADRRVIGWNRAAEALFGYTAAEMLGGPREAITPPEHRDEVDGIRQRVFAGEATRVGETIRLSRHRGPIRVSIHVVPIAGEDGAVVAMAALFSEVTEWRRISQEADRLAAIVQSSDDAIVGKDLDGIVTSWNAGAERIFGYTAEEMIGQPISRIIPADRLDEETVVLSNVRRGRSVEHFETVRRHKTGRMVDISLTVSPIRTSTGSIIGASKIARDITAQKEAARRLEEEMRTVEALNQVAPRVASTLDRDRIAQTVAETGVLMTGATICVLVYNVVDARGDVRTLYATAGAVRQDVSIEVPFSLTTKIGAVFDPAGATRFDDIQLTTSRGESPLATLAASPVRSHLSVPVTSPSLTRLGGLFFGHEEPGRFTSRHERLASGLAGWTALALENARLYRESQNASRMKDEFLAVLSHELRTPLNAILGWSGIIQRDGIDADARARGLDTIQRNARVQARLIEDLLDVSRIIAGKLSLRDEAVSLETVVRAAVEAARPAADEARLTMELDVVQSTTVRGDAARLQQIVSNLLSNAIKFTPESGAVRLVLDRFNELARIRVRDTGKGIERDLLPVVFDYFRQADATTTRAAGGLGLGLGIVKHLAELHGGSVAAESDGPGKGAQFTLTLPPADDREAIRPAAPADLGPTAERLTGARVLVVDDDRDSAEMLAFLLGRCGAVVSVSSAAAEALERLSTESYDILLADIGMPDMDGRELVRRMRDEEARLGRPRLPAVAVTAFASERERHDALEAGFDWHVGKPVGIEEITRLLAGVLRDVEA